MWDEETLVYAAGFLDGEGTFRLAGAGKIKGAKISVCMSNTYLPVVQWFQKEFGGSISKGTKRQPHHRLCYTWSVTGERADMLCRHICVFLKEKAPQAALLIAVRQTLKYTSQGKKTPPHIADERTRLDFILKGLHHVEWK